MQDVGDQRIALEQAQRRCLTLPFQQTQNEALDFRLCVLSPHFRQALEVETPEQLVVDAALQILIFAGSDVRGLLQRWRPEEARHDLDSSDELLRDPNKLKRPAGFFSCAGFSIPASARANLVSEPASSL